MLLSVLIVGVRNPEIAAIKSGLLAMVLGASSVILRSMKLNCCPTASAQTFLAGAGLYQARCKRKGNLIRVIDAVAAAEAVFGQHLRKAEVGLGRVEIGQVILVPERHINIKETRLKGLRELLSTQSDAAIECDAAIHAE